jgi:hypothetical protein
MITDDQVLMTRDSDLFRVRTKSQMAEIPECDLVCVHLACKTVYEPTEEPEGLMKGEYQLINVHLADSKFDVNASSYLIARSETEKSSVFVVFRGTKDLSDMIADFNCQPREIDDVNSLEESLYVHGGIYETAKQSMKSIVEILNGENESQPIRDVFLTGHSLGGACAMAARFIFLQQSAQSAATTHKSRRLNFEPKFHVVTFGAPLLFSIGAAKADLESRGDAVSEILKHRWMQSIQATSRTPLYCCC